MADEIQDNINLAEQTEEQKADATMVDFWKTADAKAAELTASNPGTRTIIPFSLQGDNADDHVLGYIYEPDGLTDVKLMAAKLQGFETSLPKAVQALESLILFDQSDPRVRQKKYMNGAALYLLSLIEIALPERKKK